ncbi:MAG: efflux RND transporter periplasmic adaptor subunit [Oscillospiraceae bacterium]|nr:efflux RND transporter periplasmic adaptor subunit [Oscillospiraceae bacterium]
MKRYVMLFTFTFLFITGILAYGRIRQTSVAKVAVYEVQPRLVEQTVTCTGRVEISESENVFVDIPCVVDKVHVKTGDKIKKGDVLFTVNISATKQVIADAAGISPSMVPDGQIKRDIKAPASGELCEVNVEPGGTVDIKSPCAVISSSDTLQVKVSIQESKLKNIKIGQNASVSGTAFAKDKYQGVVSYISSTARQQFNGVSSETVVDAIISLSEKDDSLKPGLSAKSKILIGSKPDSIVIPYEYVLQDNENREFVYLYENGRSVKRIVKTGMELNDGFEIVSGLSPGCLVIKNPEKIDKPGEIVRLVS